MRIKGVLVGLCLVLALCSELLAAPVPKVFLVLSSINGDVDTLYAGETGVSVFEAPLDVTFVAEMSNVDTGTAIFPEWSVSHSYTDGNTTRTENYLNRKELNSSLTFSDYGSYTINFAYSYRAAGSSSTTEGVEISPISLSIDISELFVPNAFSPNGDGINDYFKVKVKSIVSFKMSIFNRQGQLVKSGNQSSLEYEADSGSGYYICWDGRKNGEYVNDGVYFINIEAVGAGGKKYSKRSDINVLKGLDASM